MRVARYSKKQLRGQILDVLSKNKRITAGRIAGALGIGWYKTNELLEQLVKLDLVFCERETISTYWSLKDV